MNDTGPSIEFVEFDFGRHFAFALKHHLELVREYLPDWDAGEIGAKLYEAHVKEVLCDSSCRFWIGALDGRPVALIEASFRPNLDPAAGHISDVYVIPELRRKGIAGQMMRMAEAWLREKGAASVDLNVSSANERAIAFYRKMGYQAQQILLRKRLP